MTHDERDRRRRATAFLKLPREERIALYDDLEPSEKFDLLGLL